MTTDLGLFGAIFDPMSIFKSFKIKVLFQILRKSVESQDNTKWIVWFLAALNDKQRHCGISYQALRTHCGADFHDPLPAFIAHHPRIEQLITELIRQECFEDDQTIVIRSSDM
jgi:Protein of unknown function (DUF1488)